MKVKQIGLDYQAVEDRMLLKVATDPASDLAFWVTRRYFKLLWEALSQALERQLSVDKALDAQAREAVLALERQQKLAKTDFNQPFEGGAQPAEAQGQKTYSLLYGVSIQMKSANLWRIALLMNDKRQAEVNLNNDMILSLMALMQRTLGAAEWDLKLRGFETLVSVNQGNALVH